MSAEEEETNGRFWEVDTKMLLTALGFIQKDFPAIFIYLY